MKKLFLTLAAVALACTTAFAQTTVRKTPTPIAPKSNATLKLTPFAAPAGTAYSSLTSAWTYTPNAPACPTTGTLASCYNGFNVTISQGSTVVLTAAGGQGSGQLGPSATSVTWTPTSGVAFATYTTTVTAVGFDGNGNAISSTPVTATLVVGLTTLNPPTGVTLTGH